MTEAGHGSTRDEGWRSTREGAEIIVVARVQLRRSDHTVSVRWTVSTHE
jgi:hypothetical protein